jgi:phenylacetate-CoA ligase
VFGSRLYWSAFLAWHLRGQAEYPFKPLQTIRRDQARRIRLTVEYAYRHVPYYRETMDRLRLGPSDFRSAEDLAKLPLLERNQLQRDPEYFLSKLQPVENCLRLRTSGSSGSPITTYHSRDAIFQNAAHGERERSIFTRLVGRDMGYRETIIGRSSGRAAAYRVQEYCRQHALYPPRARIERQYLDLSDSPERNVRLINNYRPHIVHSYGSYLEALFSFLDISGAPFHRPKLVTYSGEGISASAKSLIEKRFQIPVLGTYQATEAFKIGFTCEHHLGVHLNLDLYPLRLVDGEGQEVPPGEDGEVVVSNLVNRGTVLLNYRLGDSAALLPERCPCGRSLPLLSFPRGRASDFIELASGRKVHSLSIGAPFLSEEQVWRFQVVQAGPCRFRVSIVIAEGCDREPIKERIREKLTCFLGDDVGVEIVSVPSIDQTSDKFRAVVPLILRDAFAAEAVGPEEKV